MKGVFPVFLSIATVGVLLDQRTEECQKLVRRELLESLTTQFKI